MSNQKIELGDRVKDPISGWEGIVVCRTTWLHGCERVGVQPEMLDKDNKLFMPEHFDTSQLEVLKEAAVKGTTYVQAPDAGYKPPGGPNRSEERR